MAFLIVVNTQIRTLLNNFDLVGTQNPTSNVPEHFQLDADDGPPNVEDD